MILKIKSVPNAKKELIKKLQFTMIGMEFFIAPTAIMKLNGINMNDRKQVTEYSSVLRGMWDTQNIEDLIHKLKHLRSQGYSKVELDKDYQPYCSESTVVLKAIKYRKENNKEYAARIEKENQQKEARRIEYERLRKEFEDPNVTKSLLFQVANEHEITDNRRT